MSDKKRLEDIEEIIEQYIPYILTGAEMNMGILEDVYTSIDTDIKWVINYAKEQAELVHKLGSIVKNQDKIIDRTSEQNKRYWVAVEDLNRIYDKEKSKESDGLNYKEGYLDGLDRAIGFLEALERESG